jgi:hypothetical protein
VQRNDVGFAAHDVKRDRQSHDDGQPDGRERRQDRRDPGGSAKDRERQSV